MFREICFGRILCCFIYIVSDVINVIQHQQFSTEKLNFSSSSRRDSFFFFVQVAPQCSPFAIKGVHYRQKSPWSLHFHPLACVSHNGTHTLWRVCKIICTVTPPDKGLWTKPFPSCFTASLMISAPAGSMHLLCAPRSVSAWPRGHPVMPRQRFHALKRIPICVFPCDQWGLPWWMWCKA